MNKDIDTTLNNFIKRSGLEFKNNALLLKALTHKSYAKQTRQVSIKDNERLEYFGDAVLKFIVSEYLFLHFPHLSEGKLTKIRSRIISDKTLSMLGEKCHLRDHIFLSMSEIKSGGPTQSTIANTLEALIGAYYLDSGLEKVRTFILSTLEHHYPLLNSPDIEKNLKDPKSSLQEWLQKQKLPLPAYTVSKAEGPDHQKLFNVQVSFSTLTKEKHFSGTGFTKKDAEQEAAKKAIHYLNSNIE